MVSLLDIAIRGVCGLDKIKKEHLVRILDMVLIWFIAFENQSHSLVLYDHVLA